MDNDDKKSLIKDIAIVSCIWGPLLFIFIGGTMWKNDKFDGTIMEQLFPAMFFGFICAWGVILISSNLFKYSPTLWWIGGIIAFIAMVALYMLEITSIFIAVLLAIFGVLMLLVLIEWISDQL